MRFAGRSYEATLHFGFSRLDRWPAAIERVQRNTVHYFPLPDRPEGSRLDPNRRAIAATLTQMRLEKIGGRHWLWFTNLRADSPEFESNDIGRIGDVTDVILTNAVTYRETQPGP